MVPRSVLAHTHTHAHHSTHTVTCMPMDPLPCTHTHYHTHEVTCTHMQDSFVHTHTQAATYLWHCVDTHTDTHNPRHTYPWLHTYMHSDTHTYTHVHSRVYTRNPLSTPSLNTAQCHAIQANGNRPKPDWPGGSREKEEQAGRRQPRSGAPREPATLTGGAPAPSEELQPPGLALVLHPQRQGPLSLSYLDEASRL